MDGKNFSGTCGKQVRWTFEEQTGTLTISGTGAMDDYRSLFGEQPWNELRDSIRTVRVCEGVTRIGADAFSSCRNLNGVSLPGSITAIGTDAFFGCSSLPDIRLPDGLTEIAPDAFYACDSLTSLHIPAGVTKIGECAFACCENLTELTAAADNPLFRSIAGVLFSPDRKTLLCYPSGRKGPYTIPDEVSIIESQAFDNCFYLTELRLPAGVTEISCRAFVHCYGLTGIHLEDPGTGEPALRHAVPEQAFRSIDGVLFTADGKTLLRCPAGREGEYTVPAGVTRLGDAAFLDCDSLTGIAIPDSVTAIGGFAFAACRGLKELTIPDSVTEIGDYFCLGCAELTDIRLPKAFTALDEKAFAACNSLKHIRYSGDSEK